jgi:hypothetical protein
MEYDDIQHTRSRTTMCDSYHEGEQASTRGFKVRGDLSIQSKLSRLVEVNQVSMAC